MPKAKKTSHAGTSLKKGKMYSHADLNIKFPDVLKPHYENKNTGKKYFFVTIKNNGKYRNELHPNGVVHEPAEEKYLVKGSGKDDQNNGRHVLVRFHSKGDLKYEYIGDEQYMIRWDMKRNKIFVK
jgi:hypothetical protein